MLFFSSPIISSLPSAAPHRTGAGLDQSASGISLDMLMCEQMILAIFIVTVTFGAEPEFQIRVVQLRPPADGTFMLGNPSAAPGLAVAHGLRTVLRPLPLLGIKPLVIPRPQEEQNRAGQ